MVLVEGILNGHHGELLDELHVQIGQFLSRQPQALVRVGVLEVKVVLTIPLNINVTAVTSF